MLHFIRFGNKKGHKPLPHAHRLSDAQCVKRSGLFDAEWYLLEYPDVAESKADPLQHYLKLGAFEGRSPSPYFDSKWYLSEYPDIVGINPLVHYIRFGKKEGRKPLSPSSLSKYAASDPSPSLIRRFVLEVRKLKDLLMIKVRGSILGLIRKWNRIEEVWSDSLGFDVPQVSILIPTYGDLMNIEKVLQSMLNYPASTSYEVLIINDDPAKRRDLNDWVQDQSDLLRLTRSRVFASSMNVGFVPSINILSRKAKGEWLFLLNDDTQICSPHWLDALVETIRSDKNIGAVGSLLLFPDSNLVCHAGLYPIVYADGNIWNACFYKHFNRNYHEVNVQKEVPMLTGAALLMAKGLFEKMGRLDEVFRSAGGFDDADLSNRLTQKGYKLVYVPESMIYHYEGQTNQKMGSYNQHLRTNQGYYTIKWETFLKKRYKL